MITLTIKIKHDGCGRFEVSAVAENPDSYELMRASGIKQAIQNYLESAIPTGNYVNEGSRTPSN